MQIEISIKAPELAGALVALAASLSNSGLHEVADAIQAASKGRALITRESDQTVQPAVLAPVSPAVAAMPAPSPIPLAQYQQPSQTAPAPASQPVPTTAQTYTLEQLAVAATPLADAGKRQDLVNLLAQFGVGALTQLPKEQYGAFATQLRAMGAKI